MSLYTHPPTKLQWAVMDAARQSEIRCSIACSLMVNIDQWVYKQVRKKYYTRKETDDWVAIRHWGCLQIFERLNLRDDEGPYVATWRTNEQSGFHAAMGLWKQNHYPDDPFKPSPEIIAYVDARLRRFKHIMGEHHAQDSEENHRHRVRNRLG